MLSFGSYHMKILAREPELGTEHQVDGEDCGRCEGRRTHDNEDADDHFAPLVLPKDVAAAAVPPTLHVSGVAQLTLLWRVSTIVLR